MLHIIITLLIVILYMGFPMQAKPLVDILAIPISLQAKGSEDPDYNFLVFGGLGGVDSLKTWFQCLLIGPQILNSKQRSLLEQV